MDSTLHDISCIHNIVRQKITKNKVMQLFEILLLLTSILYLALNQFFKVRIRKTYVLSILILILLFHLFLEGYRWQMIPAYMAWVLALMIAIRNSEKTSSLGVIIFKGIAIAFLAVLGVFLPSALPVFSLPDPQGAYEVGTRDIFLELDRKEVITPTSLDRRKLMVKVWYPSNETTGEKDPYIDQGGRHGFALKYGLPKTTFNYLDKIDTHVYRNVAIADEKFPVLLFSHGYNSIANNYYALISEIVSHGYLVFALNHTYESTGTTFPDGTELYFDYDYAKKIESGTWKDMEPLISAFNDGLTFKERHPIVKKSLKTYFVRGMVERWAQDLKDVVSQLNSWNETGFFENTLDLNKIGVFGHSRGGGAAGEALLTDDRIKAGANIDGVQWGRIVDTAFSNPFLFISADWPESKEDLNSHAYINKSRSDFYEARIQGTGHSNFMDIPFMIPYKMLSEAGDIQPKEGIEITNNLVLRFF
jgi:pimeloyl-ACP methyl ester carboxylesterase